MSKKKREGAPRQAQGEGMMSELHEILAIILALTLWVGIGVLRITRELKRIADCLEHP
jgi:hypothetical protein